MCIRDRVWPVPTVFPCLTLSHPSRFSNPKWRTTTAKAGMTRSRETTRSCRWRRRAWTSYHKLVMLICHLDLLRDKSNNQWRPRNQLYMRPLNQLSMWAHNQLSIRVPNYFPLRPSNRSVDTRNQLPVWPTKTTWTRNPKNSTLISSLTD